MMEYISDELMQGFKKWRKEQIMAEKEGFKLLETFIDNIEQYSDRHLQRIIDLMLEQQVVFHSFETELLKVKNEIKKRCDTYRELSKKKLEQNNRM